MKQTRAEMYQTVREGLSDCYVDALDALAALEAEEREAELKAAKYDAVVDALHVCDGGRYRNDTIESVVMAARRVATPPASPAADTITDAFARDFFVRHDHAYSGIEIYEWLKKQVTGPAAPPAAECAAQSEDDYVAWLRFRHRHDNQQAYLSMCNSDDPRAFKVYRAALATPCECQRLREELEERRAQLSALAEVRDLQIGRLAAELRQAVDALRVLINGLNEHRPTLFPVRKANAAAIVASYDAKHGGA